MNRIKTVYQITIVGVFLLLIVLFIGFLVQNSSENYKVVIFDAESIGTSKYNAIINHSKVWSVSTGFYSELNEKYGLPEIIPTFLVVKVKRNYLDGGYSEVVVYNTNKLDELMRYLD